MHRLAWLGVGDTVIITGDSEGHEDTLLLQVRPQSVTGTIPCLTLPSTTFTVVGVAAVSGV